MSGVRIGAEAFADVLAQAGVQVVAVPVAEARH